MPAAGVAESVVPMESVVAPALAERSGSSRSDCTDCSYCAGRSKLKTRAGVRVSINLQQYFSDQRARAFMWAPYGRCVQWLSRRIARVFGLNDDIALMSRGHMLPMIEPLLMFGPDEPIEVVNMSHMVTPHGNLDDPNVTSQRTINEISASIGHPGTNVKVCPIQCNISTKQANFSEFSTSTQGNNVAEYQKISGSEDPTVIMESTIGSMDTQSIDVSKNLQQLKQHALRLLDEHYHSVQEASAPKRMRRRRRRRRPFQETAQASAASEDEEPQHSDTAHASQDAGAAVVRNGSGSRTPRLVRALSPSPVLQQVL